MRGESGCIMLFMLVGLMGCTLVERHTPMCVNQEAHCIMIVLYDEV